MIPFYQPLLSNHHCAMKFCLLLGCQGTDVDTIHCSGTIHYRKRRL